MSLLRSVLSAVGAAFRARATATAHAVFRCARCQTIAATVDLLPPDHPQSLSRSYTLSIRDFIGHERVAVSGGVADLRAILQRADPAALYRMERLWAPFYCPTCARSYCVRHWTVVPVYDGDFFDCSYGYCPDGHKRLIED